MKNWQARFLFIVSGLLITIMCLFFVFKIFNENMIFFYTPSEVVSKNIILDKKVIKIGGYVADGSLKKRAGSTISFVITDFDHEMKVTYTGIVPALFKEGQGTIATGKLVGDMEFEATQILAKHDENYIPAEIVNKLKDKGQWQD